MKRLVGPRPGVEVRTGRGHNEVEGFTPQTDLSVGVLTVLYKGPWMVRGSGVKHGGHFSV
jgi:hypothetical protein